MDSFLEFQKRQVQIEHEMHSVWQPHRGQAPICYALFYAFVQYIFMQCGRKFGKTEFEIYCMILWGKLFPNSQIYYIADTMKHANELVWQNGRLPRFFTTIKKTRYESNADFEKRLIKGHELQEQWIVKSNNSEMRITLDNGSFIKCDGAENYANADGIEPNFIVYDEYKHHDPRFHEAMEPNLKVKKAPCLIVGTPPDNFENNYVKTARSFERMKNGLFINRPSFMNPHMYPNGEKDPEFQEEKQKYLDRGDWDVFEREYMAKIVIGGSKAIFPMIKPAITDNLGNIVEYTPHVRPHEELVLQTKKHHKDWEYFVVYDAGTTTCFAVLFGALNVRTKKVLLLDEIYEKNQKKTSSKQIFPRSREIWRKYYGVDDEWTKHYDHAAAWFANEVLNEYGEVLDPCTKDLKNKEAKLSLIKDMLLSEGLLLEISEKCYNLVNEMQNYHKDDNGRIPKENDHLIDCLRYMLNAMHYDTVPSIGTYEEVEERRAYTPEQDLEQLVNEEDPFTLEDDYYDY